MAAPASSSSSVPRDSRRTCRVCFREFPSGYALGGHMRVHGVLYAEALIEKERKVKLQQHHKKFTHGGGLARPAAHHDAVAPHVSKKRRQSFGSALHTAHNELTQPNWWIDASHLHHAGVSSFNGDDEFKVTEQEGAELELSSATIEDRTLSSLPQNYERHSDSLQLGFGADGTSYSDRFSVSAAGGISKRKLLYELRRNPKPSHRLTDQEFAFEEHLIASGELAFSNARPVSPERERACSECGKTFWSERALFGHMRCHPEREWRGANPRPENMDRGSRIAIRKGHNSSSFAETFEDLASDVEYEKEEDEDEEEEEEDLQEEEEEEEEVEEDVQEETLDRSKVVKAVEKKSSSVDEAEQKGALHNWVSCEARGKRSKMTRRARRMGAGGEATEENMAASSEEEDPDTASSEVEEDPDMAACLVLLSMAAASSAKRPLTDQQQQGTFHKRLSDGHNLGKEHQVQQRPASRAEGGTKPDLANNDESDVKFECSSCKKRFSSHQALGGHRASHKKTKGCFARAHPFADFEDENSVPFDQGDQLELTSTSRWQRLQHLAEDSPDLWDDKHKLVGMDKKLKGGHECSICHRVFSTGQALGGHKRCHWVGEKPLESGSAGSTSSVLPFSVGGHARKLDLNFPASVMDEEGDEEVGRAAPAAELQLPHSLSSSDEAVEDEKVGIRSSLSSHPGLGLSLDSQAVMESWVGRLASSTSPGGKVCNLNGGGWPFMAGIAAGVEQSTLC